MVYLIHFEKKYHHAGHYLGSCRDLDGRMRRHREGTGAKLLRALNEAGIGYEVVRVWDGGRAEEKGLKRRKNGRRLCPRCGKAGH